MDFVNHSIHLKHTQVSECMNRLKQCLLKGDLLCFLVCFLCFNRTGQSEKTDVFFVKKKKKKKKLVYIY